MTMLCEEDSAGLSRTLARGMEEAAPVAEASWNILTVESNREGTAAACLLDRGFTRYLPVEHVRVRMYQCRSRVLQTRPMFPGYLFVQADHGRWNVILHEIPGVMGVLRVGDEPAVLSSQAIAAVRSIEVEIALAAKAKAKMFDFSVGDRVQIVRRHHAFDGMAGVLQRLDKRDKAVIQIIGHGRAVAVSTSARWLRAVS